MRKTISLPRNVVLFPLMVCVLLAWPVSAWAISLHEAKAQGYVGEQADGYLGIVSSTVSGEVRALVNDINQQRKQKYQEIAQRNKTSLQVVESLAGKKAMQKTPTGQYIKPPSSGWIKK